MGKKRSYKWLLISLSLAFATLACSLVTGILEPTATPIPPPPTSTPLPPPTETSPPTQEEQAEATETSQPTPNTEGAEKADPDQSAVPEGELGIATLTWYQDSYDSWHVVGLITNNTDRTVDNVEVEIQALDADGNTIYEEVTYTALYEVPSGSTTPFSMNIWEEIPEMESFSATIVGQSVTDFEATQVEVRATRLTVGEDNVYVTGELLNSGTTPVSIGEVAAATFEANGNLVTANASYASISYLEPGELGPFRVTMVKPVSGAEAINDFTLYTNAEVVDPEDAFTITFLEEDTYFDASDNFHLIGKLQNDSDVHLNIALIAALYDADGVVLDADSLSMLPLSSLAPGESVTYDFKTWSPINNVEGLADQADSYTVQWDPAWTWETSSAYVDIAFSDEGNEYDSFWGQIFRGQVENDHGEPLDGAVVIVNLYDRETGALWATGYETIFDEIPDGGTAEYEVNVPVEAGFDIETVDIEIIAKGELP